MSGTCLNSNWVQDLRREYMCVLMQSTVNAGECSKLKGAGLQFGSPAKKPQLHLSCSGALGQIQLLNMFVHTCSWWFVLVCLCMVNVSCPGQSSSRQIHRHFRLGQVVLNHCASVEAVHSKCLVLLQLDNGYGTDFRWGQLLGNQS